MFVHYTIKIVEVNSRLSVEVLKSGELSYVVKLLVCDEGCVYPEIDIKDINSGLITLYVNTHNRVSNNFSATVPNTTAGVLKTISQIQEITNYNIRIHYTNQISHNISNLYSSHTYTELSHGSI